MIYKPNTTQRTGCTLVAANGHACSVRSAAAFMFVWCTAALWFKEYLVKWLASFGNVERRRLSCEHACETLSAPMYGLVVVTPSDDVASRNHREIM